MKLNTDFGTGKIDKKPSNLGIVLSWEMTIHTVFRFVQGHLIFIRYKCRWLAKYDEQLAGILIKMLFI